MSIIFKFNNKKKVYVCKDYIKNNIYFFLFFPKFTIASYNFYSENKIFYPEIFNDYTNGFSIYKIKYFLQSLYFFYKA